MSANEQTAVNAIRILSADAIQKAKSGHPGLPLGCAGIAYELWAKHMRHNPANPEWKNRDRFILSGGHGSAMLYSLLHLFGYGLDIEELKRFRQMGSLTPGHPEYRHTVGVEATTGPLGAGMAMAVGMAMAEQHLAGVFNKDGFDLVDHYTFVLGGDGCMMEGISSEAFSLAGALKLDKLIVLYDSNSISIEGETDLAFTEDVCMRMEAFGFQVLKVDDGNDLAAVGAAIESAKAEHTRPSFIRIRTTIGYGCEAKQGTASAHGEPLGEENIAAMRKTLGWPLEEAFAVPEDVYAHYAEIGKTLASYESEWDKLYVDYKAKYPEEAALFEKYYDPDVSAALDGLDGFFDNTEAADATRNLSGKVINRVKDVIPNLVGGSADLAPSNKTWMNDIDAFSPETPAGRNIHFGVRELATAAICNGMLLHGGLHVYGATFFVFADYMKPMARLSSLMKIPMIYVWTHDSIGVGEDGPTHEPIEQAAMLRAMPNFHVFRPCDATETACAWYSALTSKETPTALVLTRQNLTPMAGSSKEALKGGYILEDCEGTPDLILIATGSEVELVSAARAELAAKGHKVRVVSMPCMDLFEEQDAAYKEKVLPAAVTKRVAVEALSTFGWERYTGLEGRVIGMSTFGASAPYKELFPHFGFTVENVVAASEEVLQDGH